MKALKNHSPGFPTVVCFKQGLCEVRISRTHAQALLKLAQDLLITALVSTGFPGGCTGRDNGGLVSAPAG